MLSFTDPLPPKGPKTDSEMPRAVLSVCDRHHYVRKRVTWQHVSQHWICSNLTYTVGFHLLYLCINLRTDEERRPVKLHFFFKPAIS